MAGSRTGWLRSMEQTVSKDEAEKLVDLFFVTSKELEPMFVEP